MRTRRHTRRSTAALAASVLILAGCSSSSNTESEAAESATTIAVTSAAPATTTTVASDEPTVDEGDAAEESPAPGPVEFVSDATTLDEQFIPIEAGTYRVDTIGTAFSFTTNELLMVQPNGDAFFVLSHVSNRGPDDRDLVFQRISNFALPDNPTGTVEEQGDGWPADDVEGWLDSLDSGLEVTNRMATMLGGRDAVYFEVSLADGFECGEEFCAGVATNRLVSSLALSPAASYRVWVVDQGDESPILVHAAIQNAAQIDWFESAEAVLATLAFDDPAPNPIPAEGDLWSLGISAVVPAGTVELPALGGIRFELAEERFVAQNREEHHFVVTDGPADSELLIIDRDANGEPISTVDELIAALSTDSATITELGSTTLAGFPARVFDLEASSPAFSPQLLPLNGALGQSGWSSPLAGRLWVAETDRGLVLITAEVFETADDLPEVVAQSELIVETLEFIDLE